MDNKEYARQLRKKIKQEEMILRELEAKILSIQKEIPNMSHPDAPIGKRLPDINNEVRFYRIDY